MTAIRCNAIFGVYLRAVRQGYHWSEAMGCFVRFGDQDRAPYVVDLAPADFVPCDNKKGSYRVWWEGEDKAGAWLVESSPALAALVGKVTSAITIRVGEHGRIWEEGAQ